MPEAPIHKYSYFGFCEDKIGLTKEIAAASPAGYVPFFQQCD